MELFKKYPGIRLAEQKDSERIQKFYASTPMKTDKLLLTYLRSPNFFSFLHYQGEDVFVFLAENEQGELAGVGALTIREGYVKGVLSKIGYLSDLRLKVKPSNLNILKKWKGFYGDLVTNIKINPSFKCDYLLTAIMGENEKAKDSLVNHTKNPFHYEKICNYKMINILTKLKKNNSNFTLKVSRCLDMSEVLDYQERKNKVREFGFTRKFIQNAIVNWDGLNLKSFIKVELDGNIVGMCATWNPSPIKKIIFEKLPSKLKILNLIASFFTKVPSEGKELEVQYMNFLILDHDDALGAMIDFLKDEGVFKDFHLLAFADFEQKSYKHNLKGLISDETPLELYQVIAKDRMSDLVKLSGIPGFEISLV